LRRAGLDIRFGPSNQTSVERLTGRSQRQIGSSNDPANNDLTKQIRHS
jgi:hypothetical protein